jgi:Ni/Co efflux regulator RcnB
MKSLLFCALSLGIVAGSSAAWSDEPHHGNPGVHHPSRPAARATVHRTTTVHRSAPSHHTTVHRTTVHRTTVHRTAVKHPTVTRKKVTVRRNVTVHRNVNVHGRVSVHGHVNVVHFHKVFRAPHRYHIRAWVAPRGFTYRRFGIGERIPAVLLVADFFLTDFALYGLEAPPSEYVWVRDGSDAVLVDRYTGEVIEVEYDVFY